MKIAFVNNRYRLGGAETVMHQLHRGCRRAGHEARIYLGENVETAVPGDVRFLDPPLLNRLRRTRLSGVLRRVAPPWTVRNLHLRNLGRRGHDLVHVHNFHGLYASAKSLAILARRVPLVWTFHRFWGITGGCDHPGECTGYLRTCAACPRLDEWPMSGRVDPVAGLEEKIRLLADLPLTVVSPSRHLARAIGASRVGGRWRVEVIPNGVDPAEFAPLDGVERRETRARLGLAADKIIVTVVNRSYRDPLKGGDILADALPGLDYTRAQVALVGGEHEALRARLPAGADVVPLGYIADRAALGALLGASDLFLYASPRENFPCATIEAMAAGCGVVSTPTDGVLEQMREGEEGCLSSGFSGPALARTANELIADPRRVAAMGAAARRRVVQEYGEDLMVTRHLRLYEDLLASTASSRESRTG